MRVAVVVISLMFSAFQDNTEAQCGQPPRQIVVNGDAEILVAPDQAFIELGVETIDLDVEVSRTKNAEGVNKVIQTALELGVEQPDIQTGYIAIEPAYREPYQREDFLGYKCHTKITVLLRDLSKFEAVLAGSLKSGANHLHRTRVTTSELKRHRQEALTQAVKDAQGKAEKLAAQLGQYIGEPLSVTEGFSGSEGDLGQAIWRGVGGSSKVRGFAPGQIAIKASVKVSFELQEASD